MSALGGWFHVAAAFGGRHNVAFKQAEEDGISDQPTLQLAFASQGNVSERRKAGSRANQHDDESPKDVVRHNHEYISERSR